MRRLFLDDIRNPPQCIHYMAPRVGTKNNAEYTKEWDIVRDYNSFCAYIQAAGVPDLISFDHDLADVHYDPSTWTESFKYQEETGLDCVEWLCRYCEKNNIPFPRYFIHSMNPVGRRNMEELIEYYKERENRIKLN